MGIDQKNSRIVIVHTICRLGVQERACACGRLTPYNNNNNKIYV